MPKSMQSPRLPELSEATFTPEQRALAESIKSGPRGQFKLSGPFAIYLHSPAVGELAQKLGGHLRFKTSIPPLLSEVAILAWGEGRREAGTHSRHSSRPRAEIGAEGRDGDLRLRQGALQHQARQH